MFKKIINLSKEIFKSGITKQLEEEQKFIEENEQKAIEKIEKAGWKILSTHRQIISFSFRIMKNDKIEEVSIREALNF